MGGDQPHALISVCVCTGRGAKLRGEGPLARKDWQLIVLDEEKILTALSGESAQWGNLGGCEHKIGPKGGSQT